MLKNIIKLGVASAFLMSTMAIASAQNQSDKMKNNKAETTKEGTAKSKSNESTTGKSGG